MASLHSPSAASLASYDVSDYESDAIEGAFLPSFEQNSQDGGDTFNSFIPDYNIKFPSESFYHDRTIRNGDQRSSSPVTGRNEQGLFVTTTHIGLYARTGAS